MRLSKQNKIYGAVLGLALTAFGADRFLFASAPADTGEVAAAAEPVKPAKRVAGPAVGSVAKATDNTVGEDRRAIAARLDDLAQTAGLDVAAVRDAFTPSSAWVPSTMTGTVTDERTKRFIADHRLTAVMDGSRHGVAVIDGKPLRPGQTLDGFTLVSVSARDSKATFERNGGQVELRLKEAATAATVAQAN